MSFLAALSEICSFSDRSCDTWSSSEDLIDSLQLSWRHGSAPDLRKLIHRLHAADGHEALMQLLTADMQCRWSSGCAALKWSLSDYEQHLSLNLSCCQRTQLLCREFAVRNSCGDAVSRQEICRLYPELQYGFLRSLAMETQGLVVWPRLQLLHENAVISEAELDRPLLAGRQQRPEQTPWSFQKTDFEQQLILSSMFDRTISRQQLELHIESPHLIRLQNCSQTRAIGIRDQRSLACGEFRCIRLLRPVQLQITERYLLQIEPSRNCTPAV